MRGNKFVFLMFGKFPFLLRLKNVLSGSSALHFCFIRYKSVTRYLSGHCVASTLHTPIVRASSGRIDGVL